MRKLGQPGSVQLKYSPSPYMDSRAGCSIGIIYAMKIVESEQWFLSVRGPNNRMTAFVGVLSELHPASPYSSMTCD